MKINDSLATLPSGLTRWRYTSRLLTDHCISLNTNADNDDNNKSGLYSHRVFSPLLYAMDLYHPYDIWLCFFSYAYSNMEVNGIIICFNYFICVQTTVW